VRVALSLIRRLLGMKPGLATCQPNLPGPMSSLLLGYQDACSTDACSIDITQKCGGGIQRGPPLLHSRLGLEALADQVTGVRVSWQRLRVSSQQLMQVQGNSTAYC
jgi:hypothetical protein